MARGIDIKNVCLVLNIYCPRGKNQILDCTTYMHRIARTGRFIQRGVAFTLFRP